MTDLLPALRRLVYEKRHVALYTRAPMPGTGRRGSSIDLYRSPGEIPMSFRRTILPHRFLNVMFYRLARRKARVMCLTGDGGTLQGYGWLQEWGPFRRRFNADERAGTMFGPFWTAPEYRRQGVYGRLLQHGVFLCASDGPLFIYASPDNYASRRGIEAAGFELVGEWVSTSSFTFVISAHRVSEAADAPNHARD